METTTTGNVIFPLTKKGIIQRLFNEEKISFDEMWILLQDGDDSKYVPLPYPLYPYPYTSQYGRDTTDPYKITCTTNIKDDPIL